MQCMTVMIKGSTQQENITLVNIYISSTGAPIYIKPILTNLKRKIDNNGMANSISHFQQ